MIVLFKIWITILIISMAVSLVSDVVRQGRHWKSVWHKVNKISDGVLCGSVGIGAASALIYMIVAIWRAL